MGTPYRDTEKIIVDEIVTWGEPRLSMLGLWCGLYGSEWDTPVVGNFVLNASQRTITYARIIGVN